MKDRHGQSIDVERSWDRTTQVIIIINKGKPDERSVLLDAHTARDLVKDILDVL